jgi:tetratricopeptide (TPR) repeat protein
MSDQSDTEGFRPGQRWAFHAGPEAFGTSLQIAEPEDADEDQFRVVFSLSEGLEEFYGLRGLVLLVSRGVLQRSVTELLEEESALPEWWLEDPYCPEGWILSGLQRFGDLASILRRAWKRIRRFERALESNLLPLGRELLAEDPGLVRRTGSSGETPLHLAAGRNSEEFVSLLLAAGADPRARDEAGQMPLHKAISWSDTESAGRVLRLLLDAGAEPGVADREGQTPLSLAVQTGNRTQVGILVERGVAPDLPALVCQGRVSEVLAWLDRDPEAAGNAREPERLVYFLLDTLEGVRAVLNRLLEDGIGRSTDVLARCVRLGERPLCQRLLEEGVDPNGNIEMGEYLPDQTSDEEVICLLREYGAVAEEDPEEVERRLVREREEEEQAAQEQPDEPTVEALLERAGTWRELGQYDRAQADLQEAIRRDDNCAQAYNDLAWIQATCPDERFRNGEAALHNARRAVRLAGNSLYINTTGGGIDLFFRTDYRNTLAAALGENGDFEEALNELSAAEVMVRLDSHRQMLERLRACFREEQPFREAPVSEEQRQQGEQMALEVESIDLNRALPERPEAGPAPITLQDGRLSLEDVVLDKATVERVLAVPGLEGATSITITRAKPGYAQIELLAEGLRCPRLLSLDLSSNEIRDQGGMALLSLGYWPALSHLSLGSNKVGNATAGALAGASWLKALTRLDLSFNRIRVEGVRVLAHAPWLAHVEELELWSNLIRTEGLCLLVATPLLSALTKLAVGNNRLGPLVGRALAEAPALGKLEELDLRMNRLGDEGVMALAEARVLRPGKLLLSANRIGPAGIAALARGPILERVRELDLSDNPLGVEGVLALFSGPALTGLRSLDLSQTKLDVEAARLLAEAPGLDRLLNLRVREEEVGDQGAAWLLERFEDVVSIF